jgi:hypothetical protein
MFPLAVKDWLAIPEVRLKALEAAAKRPVQRSILSSPRESWATSRTLRNRPGSSRASESPSPSRLLSADPIAETESLSGQALRLHGPAFRTRQASEHDRVPPRLLAPEEVLKRLTDMSREVSRQTLQDVASAPEAPAVEERPGAMSRETNEAAARAADASEDTVRALLKEALDTCSAQIIDLLKHGNPGISDDDRKALLARIIRLYDERDIGKGFLSLVHNLWTILENKEQALEVESLRLFRDTLERLYANPRLTYAQARALRHDLKMARLPVENRELRKVILDALSSSRA